MEAMKKRDSKKTIEEYGACFNMLLKERATAPEIYRIFANLAIMNFNDGNEYEGIRLLEIALELNPNYGFGIDAMKKYEDGLYNNDIIAGRLYNILKRKNKAANEKKFKNNPANLYYQYLKRFKINFKTNTLTKSTITQVSPDGKVKIIPPKETALNINKIGRNQPCPCGAKKPGGTPVKFKHCCGA